MDVASVFVGNNTYQFNYISGEDNDTTWPSELYIMYDTTYGIFSITILLNQ